MKISLVVLGVNQIMILRFPLLWRMEFLLETSILWLLLLTSQALWIGVITGLLSRTYTPLLGTLAMTFQFLMLKKIMSTMLHHISFFTAKFKFFPRIFRIFSWFCQGVLSFQARSLGVTTPHITPVLYGNWVCSLNFQALQPCSP